MLKILIVDDNAFFREMLRECLVSHNPSLIVLDAKDGDEALQMISACLPDLIFMDVRLPKINGFELTDLVKREYPGVKVVILTSYDMPEYRDAAFQCKADHYISKDSFMRLVDLIRAERLHRIEKEG